MSEDYLNSDLSQDNDELYDEYCREFENDCFMFNWLISEYLFHMDLTEKDLAEIIGVSEEAMKDIREGVFSMEADQRPIFEYFSSPTVVSTIKNFFWRDMAVELIDAVMDELIDHSEKFSDLETGRVVDLIDETVEELIFAPEGETTSWIERKLQELLANLPYDRRMLSFAWAVLRAFYDN